MNSSISSSVVAALLTLLFSVVPTSVEAQTGLPAFTVAQSGDELQTYTLSIQFLALMTALTLLPAVVLMMTSFTRIIIVLAILRQALGTMNTPSNQVLLGLSLFLSFFIMAPVIDRINTDAVQPYLAEELPADEALEKAKAPLRTFMLAHTRETDLLLFADMTSTGPLATRDDVPFSLLLPAFVTSELKTAFQIGFLIFIPFLIIDLVVASVLMGMGMVMLSPMVISFPFKIMLFVLVDGWALVMGTLAGSFVAT